MFIDLLCNNFISNIKDKPNIICLASPQEFNIISTTKDNNLTKMQHAGNRHTLTLTACQHSKYVAAWLFL